MILVLFTWRSPQKSTERKSRPREGVRLAWTRSSRSCDTKSCSPTLQGIAWYQWWCRWKCFSLTSAISTWGGHIDRPGRHSIDPSSNWFKCPLFEPNKRSCKQMCLVIVQRLKSKVHCTKAPGTAQLYHCSQVQVLRPPLPWLISSFWNKRSGQVFEVFSETTLRDRAKCKKPQGSTPW